MSANRNREFVVPVESHSATLADITTSLAKAGINISGFVCEGHVDFGVLRFVTNDPAGTETMLRNARQAFRTHEVVSVRVPNRPGELARIAQRLAASGVTVNAAYPMAAADGQTDLLFSVDDLRSAEKLLN